MLISTRSLPESHPWKDKVGPVFFGLVFDHLPADQKAVLAGLEATAQATAASGFGTDAVLNSIFFESDTGIVMFGYEKAA